MKIRGVWTKSVSQGHRVFCKGKFGRGGGRPEGKGRPNSRPVFCLSIQSAWFKGSCSPTEVSLIPGPLTLSARPLTASSSPLMADLWPRGQICTSKSCAFPRLANPEVPYQEAWKRGADAWASPKIWLIHVLTCPA